MFLISTNQWINRIWKEKSDFTAGFSAAVVRKDLHDWMGSDTEILLLAWFISQVTLKSKISLTKLLDDLVI